VPDATGLELIAGDLRDADPEAVLDTLHFRGKGTVLVEPSKIGWVLEQLRAKGFTFLASVHGVDYYPEEPRLGVHYELLDMDTVDRLTVKLRVHLDAPTVPSVTPGWPTADHQEREVYDMFGVVFDGPPRPAADPHARGLRGLPQRRDFPIGGEPVLFTYNDARGTDYTQWSVSAYRQQEDANRSCPPSSSRSPSTSMGG
jgi:NADH-quinone oxidoreductase subunit C